MSYYDSPEYQEIKRQAFEEPMNLPPEVVVIRRCAQALIENWEEFARGMHETSEEASRAYSEAIQESKQIIEDYRSQLQERLENQ